MLLRVLTGVGWGGVGGVTSREGEKQPHASLSRAEGVAIASTGGGSSPRQQCAAVARVSSSVLVSHVDSNREREGRRVVTRRDRKEYRGGKQRKERRDEEKPNMQNEINSEGQTYKPAVPGRRGAMNFWRAGGVQCEAHTGPCTPQLRRGRWWGEDDKEGEGWGRQPPSLLSHACSHGLTPLVCTGSTSARRTVCVCAVLCRCVIFRFRVFGCLFGGIRVLKRRMMCVCVCPLLTRAAR